MDGLYVYSIFFNLIVLILMGYVTGIYWYAFKKGGYNRMIGAFTILVSIFFINSLFNVIMSMFPNMVFCSIHNILLIPRLLTISSLIYFIFVSFRHSNEVKKNGKKH